MRLRVVLDGPRDPQYNMALDEAVWRLAGNDGDAVLRLYTWRPTGVTIGRGQSLGSSVDVNEVKRRGWKLARRPTGGLALIHAEGLELTYSVVLPSSHDFYKEPVGRSAALIAEGLRIALERMGISSSIRGEASPSFGEAGELCLMNEGSSDIVVEGRKISGSAQVRGSRSLLQHGTLMLEARYEDWHRIMKDAPEPQVLARKFAGLSNLGYSVPPLGELLPLVVSGFSDALGLEPYYSSLKAQELEEAETLYREKHSQQAWLEYVP